MSTGNSLREPGTQSSRFYSNLGASFIRRWLLSVGLIVCLFSIEGLTLRSMGFRYQRPESVSHYWIPKDSLSVSSSGKRVAARTYSRRQHQQNGFDAGTILVDLEQVCAVKGDSVSARSDAIAIAPTGEWVAVSQWDGVIRIMRYADQSLHGLIHVGQDESIERLLFSPDESLLAGLSEDHIYLWDWSKPKLLWKKTRAGKSPLVLAFSTDSKQVLFQRDNEQLSSCDVRHGRLLAKYFIDSKNCLDATWSDCDQNWLFVLQERRGVSVRHAKRDIPDLILADAQTGSATCLAVDSSRIAYMDRNGQVAIRSLNSEERLCIRFAADTVPFGLAFAGEEVLVGWDSQGNIRRFSTSTGLLDDEFSLSSKVPELAMD